MYAFSVLLKEEAKGIIKFLLLVLIATMFHYEYIFFSVFVFIKKSFNLRLLFKFFIAECILIFLLVSNILYTILGDFIQYEKVLYWFNLSNYEHPSIFMDIIIITYMLLLLYICYILISKMEKTDVRQCISCVNMKSLIMMLVLMLPLLCINYTFERLFEVPLCVLLVFISSINKPICNRKLLVLNITSDLFPVIVALVLCIIFPTIIHGGLVNTILFNNLYLK